MRRDEKNNQSAAKKSKEYLYVRYPLTALFLPKQKAFFPL
jgi:hypothetical protein